MIYDWLNNALDCGITEFDFWNMTFAEINRAIESHNRLRKEDQKSKDVNFININYQDILDNIIEPLLSAENLSTRIHTLLE